MENDETRAIVRAFIIIANIRAGGTFLTHCLSDHSEVFCDRGEPLHCTSVWCKGLSRNRPALLDVLTHQPGYRASGVRLTYMQAFKPDIWRKIEKLEPQVLWLRRENVLRQAVSVMLNAMARGGQIERPQHTYRHLEPAGVALDPEQVLRTARRLRELDAQAQRLVAKRREVLALTYTEMVGGEDRTAGALADGARERICAFLQVRSDERMRCELLRVNSSPLRRTLANWEAVRAAVAESELAALLEEEW